MPMSFRARPYSVKYPSKAASADWAYVVAVSGADLIQSFNVAAAFGLAGSREGRLAILPVSPGKWQDRIGGGRELEEIQPPLMDIIVPPGTKQERLLGDFSSFNNRPAKLQGVVPAELTGKQDKTTLGLGAPGR